MLLDRIRRRNLLGSGGGQSQGALAAWRGNEPVGTTLISTQTFAVMPSGGWGYFSGAVDLSDASAPRSPPHVMNVVYPNNTPGGNSEGFTEKDLGATPFRTLYCCMWVKFSANWQGAVNSVNKIAFGYIGAGGGNNRLVIEADGVGAGPLRPRIDLQSLTAGGNFDAGLTGQYADNVTPGVFRRGLWDLVEFIATANTTGTADGGVDIFINGVKVATCSGIQWVTDISPMWLNFQINCLWSNPGDTVTGGDMNFECDEVYLSGK